MATQSKRLLSLDILRGITIAGMLLVNNPGSWGHIYAPLDHAEWIGLTPTDLVFPFFMFVMGVSMYFSLRKFNFQLSGHVFMKIARRTILLFLIGWAIFWFSFFMRHIFKPDCTLAEAVNCVDSLRILGVFPRLALTYFFGSMIAVTCKHKLVPWIIGGILAVYAVILYFGNGYEWSTDNIIARIDTAVLGENHMYHDTVGGLKLAFDPEGILSTLPGIAHVLIGFMMGKTIIEHKDNFDRINRLLLVGFAMLLGGWLLSYGVPCGKKVWSTSFVLITCGLASSVLALLIYVIDVQGHHKWCRFFHVFGVNPLFLYLCGSVLSVVFSTVPLGTGADGDLVTLRSGAYQLYSGIFGDETLGSCIYAVIFIFVNWCVGEILHRKNIIIKI